MTFKTSIRILSWFLISISLFCCINSCSAKKKNINKQVFTDETLSQEDSEFIKSKGYVGDGEELVFVYYNHVNGIAENGFILTDKKIVTYHGDTVEQVNLLDVFDLSTLHNTDSTGQSSIKLYKKDDSEIKCTFPGALDVDEIIFSGLRDMWRLVINKKQAVSPDASADSSSGLLLGVKNQEEAEKALKMKK